MTPPPPPISDQLPIALRCYVVAPDAKPKRESLGASEWTLIFDTETTTGPGQALRFGTYQLRKGDALDEAGIFYDPEGVTESELATLRNHAELHGLALLTRDEFADEVVFGQAYQFRARIVGFNLPFDISRIAIKHSPARGKMLGGYSFTLSRQKIWPNLRVKHLSRRSALISFAAPMRQRDSRGQRNRGFNTPPRRGHFVDVKTLSGALFSRNFDLAGLAGFMKVRPKDDFHQFDGPITEAMVAYAVGDVQTTWECYSALMTRLGKLGLGDVEPEGIYSEASIGKAYLAAMGIEPWRLLQPDFPPDMLGRIMGSYFGGRSEVKIRRELRQVMLCDFRSMYPTVCTIIGLWRFVTASGMTWRDGTAETRAYLESVDLAALRSPEAWRPFATLVRIRPDSDICPVRARYDGDAQSTIGNNYLSGGDGLWLTLADCVASKLLTGKAPEILEAVTFEPGPLQDGLCAVSIGGDDNFRVNPATGDFFKRVIELRKTVQDAMKSAQGDLRAERDTQQLTLKICANSTSYGIWVQLNVEDRAQAETVTGYGPNGEAFTRTTDKAEKPGEYFHPLLASLITGAARLMLAMTERLITDSGLEWAFCDTDSMAIAKPGDMADADFRQRVGLIAEWFAALNPYEAGGSILKIEGENFDLEAGAPRPLYCWAVSSKRYALFNLKSDRSPIMRKVSAHGLGHLLPLYRAADKPDGFPDHPETALRDGVAWWHCDLWHQIVMAAQSAAPDVVPLDYHPALKLPAISRYSATAPDLLAWFNPHNEGRDYADQVKPFGFLLAMQASRVCHDEAIIGPPTRGRPKKIRRPKPVAPFTKDHVQAVATAFNRETGESVPASALQTYAECLQSYHLHPESKFLGGKPYSRGPTHRRHIRATSIRLIGKEGNEWERKAILGFDAAAQPDYGLADGDVVQIVRDVAAVANGLGKLAAAKVLKITLSRLNAILAEQAVADQMLVQALAARLPAALKHVETVQKASQQGLQCEAELVQMHGLRGAARLLGVDPSNLRRRIRARLNPSR